MAGEKEANRHHHRTRGHLMLRSKRSGRIPEQLSQVADKDASTGSRSESSSKMPGATIAESRPANIESIVNGEAPSFAATAAQHSEQTDVDISASTPPRRFSLMHRKSTSTDGSKRDSMDSNTHSSKASVGQAKAHPSSHLGEESFVHINGAVPPSTAVEEESSQDRQQSKPESNVGSQGLENHESYAAAVKEGENEKSKDSDESSTNAYVKNQVAAKVLELEVKDAKPAPPKMHVSDADATKRDLSEVNDDSEDSWPPLDDRNHQLAQYNHENVPRGAGGVRWAPLKVPTNRRLQTLMVLLHCLCILELVSIFFLCCANPLLWPLLIPYLIHILVSKAGTDGSLKYRSEWFRRLFIWKWFCDYFPAQLHKTTDLPPTRKYIFGYHPHGIISHGAWAAFATDALDFSKKFPGITNSLLTLDSNFRLPFYRDYVLAMGVRSVSKESIINILSRGGPNKEGMGRAVTIVIGGARESLEAQPGRMRLILKERKGFIKLAIRTGADLVPVLAFGENEIYDQLAPKAHPFVHKVQMFVLKVWKFTLPFMHGRGIFNYDVGLMPYRQPLNIVVGAPIKVLQSASIDMGEVDRLHDEYVTELERLWDRYKDEFAQGRKEDLMILT